MILIADLVYLGAERVSVECGAACSLSGVRRENFLVRCLAHPTISNMMLHAAAPSSTN